MTKINKLNLVKDALSDVAEICNITEGELSIDYSLDLDEELYRELEKLTEMTLVLKKALTGKDMVAVQAALIMSRIYSMNLRNFFNDIYDDIETIGRSDGYNWPEIPEGYQLSEHYKFSNR